MIWGAAALIENENRIADIREMVFPHPSVCEVIREAAWSIYRGSGIPAEQGWSVGEPDSKASVCGEFCGAKLCKQKCETFLRRKQAPLKNL
jgi:hypothetical protein